MIKYGLIGYPLTHSFSKKYFTEKFERESIVDHAYELYPIQDISRLPSLLLTEPELRGLNVTIPYKEQVIAFLDEQSSVVKEIQACNCIRIQEGKLIGYNTDVIGFEKTLERKLLPHHHRALVLGTGGAAKAVHYVLRKKGIDFLEVSRTPKTGCVTYADINIEVLLSHTLVINTTPLGMYPDVDQAPDLPYEELTQKHYLYDLVYNPSKTKFLQEGESRGAVIENGADMLVIQADASWDIWNQL
jgi:shikimate dehydrogenase